MSLKKKYRIEKISLQSAKMLLDKFHYLNMVGGCRYGINFGIFDNYTNALVGVSIFHTPSAKEIYKGCFGINTYNIDGVFELGRLCINPANFEKNITSFFLSGSIKLLRKYKQVKAILTYADNGHHLGFIYQATNFKYYGLTDKKKDFFIDNGNGTTTKLQRGKCKHLKGEWVDKNQKHRYLLIFDKQLHCIWTEMKYPKGEQIAPMNSSLQSQYSDVLMPIESIQQKLF